MGDEDKDKVKDEDEEDSVCKTLPVRTSLIAILVVL
jgi:hypothetical protein